MSHIKRGRLVQYSIVHILGLPVEKLVKNKKHKSKKKTTACRPVHVAGQEGSRRLPTGPQWAAGSSDGTPLLNPIHDLARLLCDLILL